MKKLLCAAVFAAVLAASALWGHAAGEGLPAPDPDVDPGRAYFPLQRSPRSVLNESSFLVNAAIDDFVDVIGWQNLAFDRSFFFVGGGGGSLSASFQGGGAGRIGAAYFGLYFSGNLLSGWGSAADASSPSYAEAANRSYGELVLDDNLIALFGNERLGGFRFDLRFDQAKFTSLTAKNGGTESSSAPFVTTLQWGRRFGKFSPKASVGMLWEGRGTGHEADGARLAFKLEAACGSFSADYQLSTAFDKTATVAGAEIKRSGGMDHLVRLYWTAQLPVTETLTLTARPRLEFDLYRGENTTTSSGVTVNNGEACYFGFAPALEASLHYQINPAISVATGVRFNLLRLEARTRGKGDAWTDDTGSAWSVIGAFAEGGSIAFALSPSDHFTLEASVGGVLDFNEAGYKADLTKLTGGFACVFKL
jgi:hypothetical protein